MSTTNQPKPSVDPARHGASPVISTRYDHVAVEWLMKDIGCSKGELVRMGLDCVAERRGLRMSRATDGGE